MTKVTEEKFGVKITEIYAGKHKIDFSPHHSLSDDAKLTLQAQVDETYELLIQTLAQNRRADMDLFRQTEAKIFSSKQALSLHLIDVIQSHKKLYEELNMLNESDFTALLTTERERMKSIYNMCCMAKQLDCFSDFISQGTSEEEVRKALFDKLAADSQPPIVNAVSEMQSNDNHILQSMIQGLKA